MLELALKENTEAMKALTIALAAAHAGAAMTAAAAPGKPAAAPAAPKDTAKPQTTAALDYEKDVKPLALKVAKDKGRETLVKILETFKVAQANLLKPEQFADFIKACNAAVAA